MISTSAALNAAVTSALYGLECGNSAPVAQHVRLYGAEFTDFTDWEIALPGRGAGRRDSRLSICFHSGFQSSGENVTNVAP